MVRYAKHYTGSAVYRNTISINRRLRRRIDAERRQADYNYYGYNSRRFRRFHRSRLATLTRARARLGRAIAIRRRERHRRIAAVQRAFRRRRLNRIYRIIRRNPAGVGYL